MADHSRDPTLFPSTVAFVPSPQSSELTHFAQYRIRQQLGRGGMGIVYQAEDTQLHRTAALKVMRPECAADHDGRERFLREARAAAQLKHDHIVTIYQVGEERGVPFLAMEFLAGKSLEDWLRPDRKATVGETLLIGKQIARGLAAAHAAKLIHRDIKPANIWLEAPRGRVKILDFGLARRALEETEALTQDGSVVGTPAFMAPEQARGDAVDHRCDLFSLGCVLYRMLAGRLPFQGSTTFAVLSAIANEIPAPIDSIRQDVPPRLLALVNQLLAKRAEDRPASAQVVYDELVAIEKESKQSAISALLGEEKSGANASVHKRTNYLPAIVAGVALMLAGLIALPFLARGGKKEPEPSPRKGVDDTAKEESKKPLPVEATSAATLVDLLALISIPDHRRLGFFFKDEQGNLNSFLPGDKPFAIAIPWSPPEEYRLRVRCTRKSEKGSFGLALAQGNHRFAASIDFKPEKGALRSGFWVASDKPLPLRSGVHEGAVIPRNLPLAVEVLVTKEAIELSANGAKLDSWSEGTAKLSRPKKMGRDPLAILGTGTFLIDEIVLEPLSGDRGKPFHP